MPDPVEPTKDLDQIVNDVTGGSPAADPVLTAFGSRFDVSGFKSQDELLDAIDKTHTEAEQLRAWRAENEKYVQYAQQVQADEGYQTYRKQQAEAAQAAETVAKKPAWEAPPFDQSWVNRVTTDDNGNIIPKTGADFAAADGLRKYLEHKQRTEQEFYQNPLSVLKKAGLDQELEAYLSPREKALQERLDKLEARYQQQEQSVVQTQHDSFLETNKQHLFQLDANGERQTDAQGQPLLTPLGRTLDQHWRELEELGIPREKIQQKIHTLAAGFLPQEQTDQQPAKPRGADGKFLKSEQRPVESPVQSQKFLNKVNGINRLPPGAAHNPSRNGSELAPALDRRVKQNGSLTGEAVFDAVLQDLKERETY